MGIGKKLSNFGHTMAELLHAEVMQRSFLKIMGVALLSIFGLIPYLKEIPCHANRLLNNVANFGGVIFGGVTDVPGRRPEAQANKGA